VGRGRRVSALLAETFSEYWNDDVPQLAASLAFYTIFSLAPVLIIAVAIVSLIFGSESAREQVTSQVWAFAGPVAADVVEVVLEEARRKSPLATAVGLGTILVGSTAAFVSLHETLNKIWGITSKPGKAVELFLKKRLLSFVMVLAMGMLLLAVVALGALIYGATQWIQEHLGVPSWLLQSVNLVVSFVVVTVAFAVIYKVLPDAEIAWRHVWVGASATALLFIVGKQLIGLYLAKGTVGSAYGAAGSYVVFLVWVYYSAQVFLLGAEFTQVYVRARGSQIRPSKHAVRVTKIIEGMQAS
jgi:membrane protein